MATSLPTILFMSLLATGIPAAEIPHTGPSWNFQHGPLRVDADGRGLEHADGTPFLWLGDTAWELFHRLDRAEVELYLEKRRSQGFTVVQAVALAEWDGLNAPNAYGARPLVDNDPSHLWVTEGNDPNQPPQYDYWDHVDYIFDVAAAKGITIAFLPTWGDKVPQVGPSPGWGCGPQVFTPANARTYGQALAKRYGSRTNLIWVNGGDRAGDLNLAVWNALAAGIRDIDQGRHLMTYHPVGGGSSRQWFIEEPWHAFTMIQTGHYQDTEVWNRLSAEWNATPIRPVINGEPTYEAHPFNWDPSKGYATDHDTRKYTYWCLLSGAFGHTYGCHPIWQFHAPDRKPALNTKPDMYWKSVDGKPGAIDLPGAWCMLHTRRLLLSRPQAGRIPDQALLLSNSEAPAEHQVAARAKDSSWAMVYTPAGLPITVDLAHLAKPQLRSWWYDPRHGTAQEITLHHVTTASPASFRFVPPSEEPLSGPGNGTVGHDWVLVLDDAERGFAPPGTVP